MSELPPSECFALLGTVTKGYLAVTHKALPAIVPVGIHVLEDEIAIQPMIGDAIPLSVGTVVALHADSLGDGESVGWAVQVVGFLKATDDDALSLGQDRQADAATTFTVRPEVISGWRPNF